MEIFIFCSAFALILGFQNSVSPFTIHNLNVHIYLIIIQEKLFDGIEKPLNVSLRHEFDFELYHYFIIFSNKFENDFSDMHFHICDNNF